jgi:hypothetical protein
MTQTVMALKTRSKKIGTLSKAQVSILDKLQAQRIQQLSCRALSNGALDLFSARGLR